MVPVTSMLTMKTYAAAAGFETGEHLDRVGAATKCQQVSERVFSSFGRDGEQMSSKGWPGGSVVSPGM
jgi:hypothetical protein